MDPKGSHDRKACVEVPALPLQLLLRRHPEWRGKPLAVVDHDRPQGVVLWASSAALAKGVRPGLRYASGLALAGDLCAGEVPAGEISAGVVEVLARLMRFSPRVEPASGEGGEAAGVFFLDASGLEPLYPSLEHWGRDVVASLVDAGFTARVTVGFTRFGSWAASRSRTRKASEGSARESRGGSGGALEARRRMDASTAREPSTPTPGEHWTGPPEKKASEGSARESRGESGGASEARKRRETGPHNVAVIPSPGAEQAAARRATLQQVGIVPRVRDALERLGVTTVGAFLDLPPEGVRRRFGIEAAELHRRATREDLAPVQAGRVKEAPAGKIVLDDPEPSATGLLFLVKRLLPPLLTALAARHEGVAALVLTLGLDTTPAVSESVERLSPAAPTLDEAQLLELVRLRLETRAPYPRGVVEIGLSLEGATAPAEQVKLFAAQAARDRRAAEEAMARVRAELGDDAVVRARLVEAHLPEARYRWERVADGARSDRTERTSSGAGLAADRPGPGQGPGLGALALVRRIQEHPSALAPRPRHAPDGWLLRGVTHGSVERFVGPYVVSGGWWTAPGGQTPVHREYHFALMQNGDIYWVYYDRVRRRWFLHGQVE